MLISNRLRLAVKTSRERQYELAHTIGVHPSVLSAWLNDITRPRLNDPRILALGELLGVPARKCFEQRARSGAAR